MTKVLDPFSWARGIYDIYGKDSIAVDIREIVKNMGMDFYIETRWNKISSSKGIIGYNPELPECIFIPERKYPEEAIQRACAAILYIATNRSTFVLKNNVVNIITHDNIVPDVSNDFYLAYLGLVVSDIWIRRNCSSDYSFYDIDAWAKELNVHPHALEDRLELYYKEN